MNKKRNEYVYHLVGIIDNKAKQLPKEGKYLGTYFWNLKVEIEKRPEIKSIKVFPDRLENKKIWSAIEKNEYLGKNYTFYCRNHKGIYYLINWKELGANSLKNKENYGSN